MITGPPAFVSTAVPTGLCTMTLLKPGEGAGQPVAGYKSMVALGPQTGKRTLASSPVGPNKITRLLHYKSLKETLSAGANVTS